VTRVASQPAAPTLFWLCAAAAAFGAAALEPGIAIAVAAAGAAASLWLLEARPAARGLTALAMVPVALADSSPAWLWICAGALIGIATSLLRQVQGTREVLGGTGELQRHLSWCRRREDEAHLLVLPLTESEMADPSPVLECFRITDSVALSRATGGFELQALLDDKRFVREGLERRLRMIVGEQRSLGWAKFPDDAVTVESLVEHAHTNMALETSELEDRKRLRAASTVPKLEDLEVAGRS
jgi:hypothetical protein